MSKLDDVLERLRTRLGDDVEVPDVAAAVDAMSRAFRQVTADSDALSGSAVARMLGVSRQAVNQRAGRGSLLAIADASGVRYPGWQFRDGTPVRGLLPLVRAARDAGVDDAALVAWIEADERRIHAVASNQGESLIDEVHEARRRRAPITRKRVSRRVPRLADAAAC